MLTFRERVQADREISADSKGEVMHGFYDRLMVSIRETPILNLLRKKDTQGPDLRLNDQMSTDDPISPRVGILVETEAAHRKTELSRQREAKTGDGSLKVRHELGTRLSSVDYISGKGSDKGCDEEPSSFMLV
jgi:hypothetical protein